MRSSQILIIVILCIAYKHFYSQTAFDNDVFGTWKLSKNVKNSNLFPNNFCVAKHANGNIVLDSIQGYIYKSITMTDSTMVSFKLIPLDEKKSIKTGTISIDKMKKNLLVKIGGQSEIFIYSATTIWKCDHVPSHLAISKEEKDKLTLKYQCKGWE